MTPKNKPEWFEISENDNSANVRPISKRLPIVALVASALILGIGAVVAQTQEEPPASAVEALTPTPTVQDQNQVVVTQPSTPVSKAPIVKTPVAKAPTIAKPPTGRGGEDEDESGERHEGRERGGYGEGDD
jgi:hypothetical protein